MFQLLVTCHANVCRSPYAAALIRSAVSSATGIRIVSAGINAQPGQEICSIVDQRLGSDPHMTHRSRPLDNLLVNESDLILSMGPAQNASITAAFPDARHKVYGLVEATVLATQARVRSNLHGSQWLHSLPHALNEVRGLVELPALPNPRGRWHARQIPGRIADGHSLSQAAHVRTLEQVEGFALRFAGLAAN